MFRRSMIEAWEVLFMAIWVRGRMQAKSELGVGRISVAQWGPFLSFAGIFSFLLGEKNL